VYPETASRRQKEVLMVVEALKEGNRIVGTMIRMVRNPAVARVARQAGLDFVMFDMEHGSYSLDLLSDIFAVARAVGLAGFVRVPELSKAYISRVMDAGAVGVMVPMLESVEQARAFVGWAKYAPVGKRGFGSAGGHTNYAPASDAVGFMKAANEETLTIAQIETSQAVERIDAIAAVEGIDALLIGPNDLAISLGHPGDLMNKEVTAAISKVADSARSHGKIFGMHAPDALTEMFIPKGLRLLMSGLDHGMLVAGMKAVASKWGEPKAK
jgi:2-keto-3-deoxy-L-rhamnonate aldolase RhmA